MSEQIGRWRATYTPGQWTVLGGPTSLVILRLTSPRFSTMINGFWDVIVQSDSLENLVRQLAQYNVERMPDFAAFFWHEGEMRSLVRGALEVLDPETGETVATGEGVQTWTESGLGEVRRVRVVMEQDVDVESQLRLPLVVGAVSASTVDLDADAAVSSPQRLTPVDRTATDREDHPAEIEADSGVMRQSAEDRVANLFEPSGADSSHILESEHDSASQGSRGTGPGGAAGGFGAAAAAGAGAAAGAAGTAFGTPPPPNPFGQHQGQGPYVPGPGGFGQPGPGQPGHGQPGQPGPGRPGSQPFPRTEAFTPGFAHSQPGGQSPQGFQEAPPPYGGPQQPPAYGQGGQTGPGGPGGPGTWQPVNDQGRGEHSGELVLAVTCPQNHPNPPEAQRCRRCGGPLQGQPRMVPRPVMALLRPSTGAPVEVDRSVLIGRSPQANRVARDQLPKLLTVPSPSHDISRTHVQISPEGWDLVATDLHSTNGTLLIRPGHPEPERMAPGEPMQVYPGCVLDLGDGVTILVDHPA